MVLTDDNGVGVKATLEKWDKTKALLVKTLRLIDLGEPIDRKTLESYRGSLVYLQRTYPSITPYVKGFHLTINGWRPDRDAEGWRLLVSERNSVNLETGPPPATVRPVPRLREDVVALRDLFSSDFPPTRYVRSNQIQVTCYSFADASGGGFGSTTLVGDDLEYSHGVWNPEGESASSNYRELENLVNTLEKGVEVGSLLDSKIWIFTDNITSEAVFWKGHSPSRLLNDLALILRRLEMTGRIRIQMIHIPGTRMIAQGTDGLSCGDFTEGVMAGQHMLEHVPVHLTALERQPGVCDWLAQWIPGGRLVVLDPSDWFDQGHGFVSGSLGHHGVWVPVESTEDWFLWHPEPVLSDIAMDELCKSHHKRPHLSHVVIIPCLMTFAWRQKLSKLCDLLFEIPPGARPFWPISEHEPLTIGLTLHFSAVRPWQAKLSAGILELEGQLRSMWSRPCGDEWPLLREFCNTPQRMEGL